MGHLHCAAARSWPASLIVLALVATLATGPLAARPGLAGTASPGDAGTETKPDTAAGRLRALQVNELGVVPVLMYHRFTDDPSLVSPWTTTFDQFIGDLQWLHDHDFVTTPLRDVLENTIDVPPGKHPVVLTFDDASPSQFLVDRQADGSLTPRPRTAVGILESFFAAHPDFGHTALFAVVPNYCFADITIDALNSIDVCDAKIAWLAEHGYEIANHTMHHASLASVTPGQFVAEVGDTMAWIDARVSGRANLSRTLVLPYGERPDPALNPGVYDLLANGFAYGDEWIALDAVVDAGGGVMYAPASTWWDPSRIMRFNADPDTVAGWFDVFASGTLPVYTSDGDPETIALPDPLPDYLLNEYDAAYVALSGRTLVRYEEEGADSDPAWLSDGDAVTVLEPAAVVIGALVETVDDGIRIRRDPSLQAAVVTMLAHGAPLEIVDGPMAGDGYVWWRVTALTGETGWVAGKFLHPMPAM